MSRVKARVAPGRSFDLRYEGASLLKAHGGSGGVRFEIKCNESLSCIPDNVEEINGLFHPVTVRAEMIGAPQQPRLQRARAMIFVCWIDIGCSLCRLVDHAQDPGRLQFGKIHA